MLKEVKSTYICVYMCVYICMFNFMLQAALLLTWVHLQVQLDNDHRKRCKVVASVQEQYLLSYYKK